MDHATQDGLMQIAGLAMAILPMLALGTWLALASRRRQAAERAEHAETPSPNDD